jgi:diadenosine tetraphosphatase ApaH/serine/threonine PP2A family protein phosphatase
MKAILSDIHSNLEALQAVLDDISHFPVEDIYCLGDVIGYGPNPRECLDLVRERCSVALLGNHDQAVLHEPEGFNPVAALAVYWTREKLLAPVPTAEEAARRWAYLERLACGRLEPNGLLFVHASPCDPVLEYVFPHDARDGWKMCRLFAEVERCCFHGHTHIPGIFVEPGQFFKPDELDGQYRLGEQKVLCNVGSVGQPRDDDLRACYVLLEGDTIRFRRVKYDYEKTARKIYATKGLHNSLGDRLCGRAAATPKRSPVGV